MADMSVEDITLRANQVTDEVQFDAWVLSDPVLALSLLVGICF